VPGKELPVAASTVQMASEASTALHIEAPEVLPSRDAAKPQA